MIKEYLRSGRSSVVAYAERKLRGIDLGRTKTTRLSLCLPKNVISSSQNKTNFLICSDFFQKRRKALIRSAD
ncbi:hypothetical protein D3C71_1328510 [compost metagenome]